MVQVSIYSSRTGPVIGVMKILCNTAQLHSLLIGSVAERTNMLWSRFVNIQATLKGSAGG